MSLIEVKQYLQSRIQSDQLLSLTDQQLTRYLNSSYVILNTYFYLDQLTNDNDLAKVLGEQMIFLFNGNIDLNLFYQYEGLTSFTIGQGAIKGTVDYSITGPLVSPLVRGILQSLDIEQRVGLPGQKVKNGYTWL